MALVFAIMHNLHKFFLSFFLSVHSFKNIFYFFIFLAWFMKFDRTVNDISLIYFYIFLDLFLTSAIFKGPRGFMSVYVLILFLLPDNYKKSSEVHICLYKTLSCDVYVKIQ